MVVKHKPVVLVIMDGWGIRRDKRYNAIKSAKTPYYNSLLKKYPNSLLSASGADVGLPAGFIGNSEVGHLNIGAGRIVKEKISEIDDAIKNKSFFKKKAFLNAINHCKKNRSTLHLMGLIQMEGVHSMSTHLSAILKMCSINRLDNVIIHAFTDGRDSPPRSAQKQLKVVKEAIRQYNVGKFGTITGRYYAMDRDNRWNRTQVAYDSIMNGIGKNAKSVDAAIKDAYKMNESDEFIMPRIIAGYHGIKDGDAIIMFNYRLDRARQLTLALINPKFKEFNTRKVKNLKFSSMTEYYKDEGMKHKAEIAFKKEGMKNILSEWLSKNRKKQFRTAETEKFAHVTYFFNGQREKPFFGETRKIVSSPKVATYDLQPEMSAQEVQKIANDAIRSEKYDFIVINFANTDMVGHTGIMSAAIKAVETVDSCIASVVEETSRINGAALIISDHGNCEEMSGEHKTSHTTNKVPCILVTNVLRKNKKLKNGRLCDVAPTVLSLMGLKKPKEMTGKSLV